MLLGSYERSTWNYVSPQSITIICGQAELTMILDMLDHAVERAEGFWDRLAEGEEQAVHFHLSLQERRPGEEDSDLIVQLA